MVDARQNPQTDGALPTEALRAPIPWLDTNGRTWRVTATKESIVFESDDSSINLPRSTWPTDLSVQRHGAGFIVRVDRFDESLGFFVSAEQMIPLLYVIQTKPLETPVQLQDDNPADHTPLLWPKVSRLAVAALCLSSLTVIPALGILFATVIVTLLILHRMHVRKSRSWVHSRRLCTAATILTIFGVTASAFSTWGIWRQWYSPEQPLDGEKSAPSLRSMPKESARSIDSFPKTTSTTPKVATIQVAEPRLAAFQPPWEKDHNWSLIAAGLFVILLSLSVHEAAHAITGWWLGDDFARRLGRVTLNPLAHIDPVGSILLPLMLFLAGANPWGWARPVMGRPEVTDHPRRTMMLVALAGPVSNLLLASASLALLLIFGYALTYFAPQAAVTLADTSGTSETISVHGVQGGAILGPLFTILKLSFLINVLLAFFNLIPIPPLDGGWVLGGLFPRTIGALYDRIRPYSFLIFLGLIYSNLSEYLIYPAFAVLIPGLVMIHICFGF